jgi:hypothetical protein
MQKRRSKELQEAKEACSKEMPSEDAEMEIISGARSENEQ